MSMFLAGLVLVVYVAASPLHSTAVPTSTTSFILIGDSTTANGTTPNSGGWGNGFCGSTNTSTPSSLQLGTSCINIAHDGATIGIFVADGFWNISVAAIEGEVAKGQRTFVTIQFGHNDMKIADPESMGTNLTIMVQEIRALGAEPILVTSLTRRTFNDNGTIADTLQPWADETILIAEQQGTHLLDLHEASIEYCEAIGPDAAHRLNRLPDDNTHLNVNGTIVFGRMVADLMAASFPLFALPIIPNPRLTFNITHGIASY
ncbi:SGNH hydrolase [Guyanagaster necrorhizus]|uniref:SGNH hydrolase n=1 Tax=Guyanagaster necrorhizus TaxID=856835 RepID=A0A9P8AWY6_9AGAR|nr:SGNH hydrolase [Guyanagaster necrorhizus MCA 3950]KAG7451189.1 SGNH hydrolase [Guyanagaster necrorhizus MCA 3950]